jgi:hypothetical protein
VRLKGATIGDIAGGDIDIKGRATRHATDAISGWDPKCGGKGGGGQEAPDCGTRSFDNASAMLSFQPGDKLSLDGGLMPGTPVFSNCKLLGTGAPTLLSTDSSFRPIASKFPRREVFDKSLGKVIVIGRGKQVRTDAETTDTTRIRWEATFVRVRKG